MKKKLLSTLTAVAMLSSLVTPVMAAPPSHAGDDHYSFATGYEGNVTEAEFLQDSYTMKNGNSRNFLDELMAYVNDSLLAHELRYVEWYIENHDSNYPFSLGSSTDGTVYCGFDSGSATLTAIITRTDGALVKASTKIVAAPRTIQYASGFSITNSATFFTGVQAIDNGEIILTPTPENSVFSEAQYNAIKAAIDEGDLDISLRTGNNIAFDHSDAYQISAYIQPFSPKSSDPDEVWNGFSGEKALTVYYPIDDDRHYSNYREGDNGKVVFEIHEDAVFIGATIFGEEIKDIGTSVWGSDSNEIESLVNTINNMSEYDAQIITSGAVKKYDGDFNRIFVEITLKSDSRTYGGIKTNIETAWDKAVSNGRGTLPSGYISAAVFYAQDYTTYDLSSSLSGLQSFNDILDAANNLVYVEGTKDGNTVGAWIDPGISNGDQTARNKVGKDVVGKANANGSEALNSKYADVYGSVDEFLAYLINFDANYGAVNYILTKGDGDDETPTGGYLLGSTLRVYENGTENDGTLSPDKTTWATDNLAGTKITVYDFFADSSLTTVSDGSTNKLAWASDSSVVSGDDVSDLKKDVESATITIPSGTTKIWGEPTNWTGEADDGYVAEYGDLGSFTANHGTTAYNYTLSVANFPRYQGTVFLDYLDDVSRTTRIDTNVAVQPSSLHQTSAITVTVGDIVNLTDHFKVTSTSNVWNDIDYNEAYFNNDSTYAYNDYGVITNKDTILGVREGKNKVVASVLNSYTGQTHYAEVIVTVVPRTGDSTTVTPTSNPLAITPTTHTTTLGGAGVQLTPSYYGEATFDVNDNVLPTLQSDNNGKIEDVVKYKSNDPTVLAVTEDGGFVTPVGVGTGTVTAYVPNSNFESTFTMTVIAPTIPQEETSTDSNGNTSTGVTTPVPSTAVNALGQLF